MEESLPYGEVHVDTPRDPKNGIHSLRTDIDWDAIEAENAMYAEELARHKAEEAARPRPVVQPIVKQPKKRVAPRVVRELAPRACAHCGKEYVPRHPKGMYCSKRCSKMAFDARKRQEREEALKPRACARCGEVFMPARAKQKYCSTYCQRKAYVAKFYTSYTNQCKQCGKVWVSKRKGMFCSDTCRSKFYYIPRRTNACAVGRGE
jgi:hypothetical protein